MITSKQRANLRKYANQLDAIFQIGKSGIEENSIKQVQDALLARELVKLRVLETAGISAKEAANLLAEATESDIIQVIGSRFVLFKRNPKTPKYDHCL